MLLLVAREGEEEMRPLVVILLYGWLAAWLGTYIVFLLGYISFETASHLAGLWASIAIIIAIFRERCAQSGKPPREKNSAD